MPDRIRPSGRQVVLPAGRYAAEVTEVGATLRSLTCDGRPLILGFGADEMASAGRGQVLLPWPNRIEDGRYDFDGTSHQLPLSEPARRNASHGLVRWLPWQLRSTDPGQLSAEVVLHPQPGYPFTLVVAMTYALSDDGLRVRIKATNVGDRAAPYGHGLHPYLRPGPGQVDDWELKLPARRYCPVDERGLPADPEPVDGTTYDFRATRRIGATSLDNPFTDLVRDEAGRATVTLRDPDAGAAVELWIDHSYRWLQVYTGEGLSPQPRAGLAVEPMTCPPNAFRSSTDVVRLEPGASQEAEWGIRAG